MLFKIIFYNFNHYFRMLWLQMYVKMYLGRMLQEKKLPDNSGFKPKKSSNKMHEKKNHENCQSDNAKHSVHTAEYVIHQITYLLLFLLLLHLSFRYLLANQTTVHPHPWHYEVNTITVEAWQQLITTLFPKCLLYKMS